MPPGIGATGSLGVAFETTANTYVAPVKWLSLLSENLHYIQDTIWRRVMRGTADVVSATPGNVHIAGDIHLEATPDTVAWVLYACRAAVTKTGAGPYTYNVVGTHGAGGAAGRTMSMTIVRNGVVFGYVGVVVSSFTFTINNGGLELTVSVIGSDEAVQSAPTVVYPTNVPFGAGMYNIQIPTATQLFDMDTFTFTVDDHAVPQYRLKNTGRGAQFVQYGERDCTLQCQRDFISRAEYDTFKTLTQQSITLKAIKDASNEIDILMPVSDHETYEVTGLSGEGVLVRAAITYRGLYDITTTAPYKITVITTENIT